MRGWMVMCGLCLAFAGAACGDRATEAAPATGGDRSEAAEAAPATGGEPSERGAVYECPMRCKVEGEDQPHRQAEPGQCPVCGMDLEKQTRDTP